MVDSAEGYNSRTVRVAEACEGYRPDEGLSKYDTWLVLCSGPSLQHYSRGDYCPTIAVNTAINHPGPIDYWVCIDGPSMLHDTCKQAAREKLPVLFTRERGDICKRWQGWIDKHAPGMEMRITEAGRGTYSMTSAINIACAEGARDILIFGSDMWGNGHYAGYNRMERRQGPNRWANERHALSEVIWDARKLGRRVSRVGRDVLEAQEFSKWMDFWVSCPLEETGLTYTKAHTHLVRKIESRAALEVKDILKYMDANRDDIVVDFGAGSGKVIRLIQQADLNVQAVDFHAGFMDELAKPAVGFVEGCLWNLPARVRGKHGYCVDVMEHIPDSRVDWALDCIKSAISGRMYFSIHSKDFRWWREKLTLRWASCVQKSDDAWVCE